MSFLCSLGVIKPHLDFQVEYLLREWVRLCHQPGAGKESEKAFSTFVALVSPFVFVV